MFVLKKPSRRWLLALIALAAFGLLAWLRPDWVAALSGFFGAATLLDVANRVRGFGIWAPLASLGLMTLQAVIVPLPGAFVAAANGLVFGAFWGTLLSWLGGLIGGSLAFWLARWFGADFVARQVGQSSLRKLGELGAARGFWTILIARLIPGLSFDLISYAAGLSQISYWRFLVATAVGMLPGTIMFTLLGSDLPRAESYAWRLSLVGLLGVVGYLVAIWWLRRRAD